MLYFGGILHYYLLPHYSGHFFIFLCTSKVSFLVNTCSGSNKGQKLVGCFCEDRTFCRLLIIIPLKMYSKIGQPKWIWLVKCWNWLENSQWPTVISSTGMHINSEIRRTFLLQCPPQQGNVISKVCVCGEGGMG